MSEIRGVFFDVSGVLVEGSDTLPGAIQAIHKTRLKGLPIRFVTNTTTRSHSQLLTQLNKMGLPISSSELFTAPQAAISFLKGHKLKAYCLIHPNLNEEFAEFMIDPISANAVVIGDARERLNFESLNYAFEIIMAGKPFVAIGKNKYFKEGEGLMLDSGAFIEGLEWATGKQALITGKPSHDFYFEALKSIELPPEEVLMIGDDVKADVLAAMECGLQGALVKTGKYIDGDEKDLPDGAMLWENVGDLSKLFN